MSDDRLERIEDQLHVLHGDVKEILGRLGNLRGQVAVIAGIVSAVIVGAVLAFVSGCSGYVPTTEPAPDITLQRSVVGLLRENGTAYCTGFATERGIVTAAHCLHGERVYIGTYDDVAWGAARWRGRTEVTVRDVDNRRDVALLGHVRHVPELRVRRTPPRLGERIRVVGHPHGFPYVTTHGRVSRETHATVFPGVADPSFGVDIGGDQGNSGSPVIDVWGNVIGVFDYGLGTHTRGAAPLWRLLGRIE